MKTLWIVLVLIAILSFFISLRVVDAIGNWWYREDAIAQSCPSPILYKITEANRFGVRYIYKCSNGTMIEVGKPIPGAKIP